MRRIDLSNRCCGLWGQRRVEKTITPSGATFVVATQMSPSHHELDRPGAEWKMIVRHGKHATRPVNNGVNTVVLPVLEQVVSMILSLKADTFVLPVHCQNSRCSSLPGDALPCAHATSQLRAATAQSRLPTTLYRAPRLALHRWLVVRSARSK